MLSEFRTRIGHINETLSGVIQQIGRAGELGSHKSLQEVDIETSRIMAASVLCPETKKSPKRLRPLLVVLAAEACSDISGRLNQDRLYRAAVAVELYHNSTLIHDDMIDEDIWRRGLPTVLSACEDLYEDHLAQTQFFLTEQAKLGYAHALLIGNMLSHHSFEILLGSGFPNAAIAVQELNRAAIKVNKGQVHDLQPLDSIDAYLGMVELKTADLFAASARIGAYLADTSYDRAQKAARLLGDMFTEAGIAFQIQDDLLDIHKSRGAKRGSDIRNSKRNILYLHLRESNQPDLFDEFCAYFNTSVLDDEHLERAIHILELSGAVEAAKATRDLHYSRSCQILMKAADYFLPNYRDAFATLIHDLTYRDM